MFDVGIDRTTRRVSLTITQFLDVAAIRDKEREIAQGVDEILRMGSHFDLFVRLEGLGPVSREVGEHLDSMIGKIVAKGLRKSAHVGFGALAKMQMQRLSGNDSRFQFFATVEEALQWLDE